MICEFLLSSRFCTSTLANDLPETEIEVLLEIQVDVEPVFPDRSVHVVEIADVLRASGRGIDAGENLRCIPFARLVEQADKRIPVIQDTLPTPKSGSSFGTVKFRFSDTCTGRSQIR